jgi:hypothetical protein
VDQAEEKGRHRKVYAKGFFDGVRSILSGKGNPFMNQKKQLELLNRQTALAQKVFDAVPIQEPWEVGAIGRELYRLHNSAPDHRTVYGCLSALESAGLVREIQKGMFIRSTVKAVPEKIEEEKEQEVPTNNWENLEAPGTIAVDPVARLADLAASATALAAQVKVLAGQIEEAAIEIELQHEQAIKDSQTLKQLQTLLKGLGVSGN